MKRRRWHLVDPDGNPLRLMTKPEVIAELVSIFGITKAQAKSNVEHVTLLPDKRFLKASPAENGWTYEFKVPSVKP